MKLITLFISIFILATLLVGNTLYESDLENGKSRDIYNWTTNLDWDNAYNYSLVEPSSKEEIIPSRMVNIIHRFMDFFGFAAMESMKTGIEFGYENPQYNYYFAFEFFKWLIILSIISILASLFIPLLGLITISGMGIHKLIKSLKNRSNNDKIKQPPTLKEGQ